MSVRGDYCSVLIRGSHMTETFLIICRFMSLCFCFMSFFLFLLFSCIPLLVGSGQWAPSDGTILCPETRPLWLWSRSESHLAGSRHGSGWNGRAEYTDGPDFQPEGLTVPVHGAQKVPRAPLHCGTGLVLFVTVFDSSSLAASFITPVSFFSFFYPPAISCPGLMLSLSVILIMTIWMLDLWPALMRALEGRYAGTCGGSAIINDVFRSTGLILL